MLPLSFKVYYLFMIFSMTLTEILTVETCRLSRNDDGTFFKCELQGQCADADPPNAFQQCVAYNFEELNQQNCRSNCCLSLSPASTLSAVDIQQCRTDWNQKQLITTLSIVVTILGSIAVVMAISFTLAFGCIRNPYTNQFVWTGCCCCRKQVDFREYRDGVDRRRKQVETDGHMYKDEEAAP